MSNYTKSYCNHDGGYFLSVLWGQDPISPPTMYEFDSEAERTAYVYGIEDTVGWLGADYIEHDKPKKFEMTDFTALEEVKDNPDLVSADFHKNWEKYKENDDETR